MRLPPLKGEVMDRLIRPGTPGRVVSGLGQILRDSFFQQAVNVTMVGTVAGENQTPTIQIQNDADFLCVLTTYDSNIPALGGFGAGVNAQFGGAIVQLTDGGSNRLLSNIPVPASALFGTAQRPFWWPLTHLFRANTFIGLSVSSVVAVGSSWVLRFVFSGYKVPLGVIPISQASL